MAPPLRRLLKCLSLGGVLVFAQSLWATTALATCGDYLHIPGESDHGTMTDQRPDSHEPGKPCHGPGCRSQNRTPLAPTAPTTETIVKHWALGDGWLADGDGLTEPRWTDRQPCRSIISSDPPLRPPQECC